MKVIQIRKKTDLIEMIVYGCMVGKLSEEVLKDISFNRAMNILKEKNINIKSLPEYENVGLKKKDVKPYKKECSVKIIE